MTRGQAGFLLLWMLGILLIIIGVQGSLGVTFAILFAPAHVTLDESS